MQANTNPDLDPRYAGTNGNIKLNQNEPKKFRLRISQRLHWTATLAFISYITLLISFASPYWLSSYKFTDSHFKRLGLWDFCFQDYRHPTYQYDMKFDGCHWIYSQYFANIRDWLQPSWFMFVQAVTTIALCTSTLGLLAVSIIFMHYLIQYQLIIMCATLVLHMCTTLMLFFALIVFYFKAFDRTWILFPEFNHVDWAFFFALVAMGGNGFASALYYKEIKLLKEKMAKLKRLIVASPNGRQSIAGGDVDSLDAVYATRSGGMYNNQDKGRTPLSNKDGAGLMYPHFTQV